MKRNRAPRLTHDELLDLAREHRQRGQAVAALLNRRRNVGAEADAEIAEMLADTSPAAKAYRLLGEGRHKEDARRFAAERLRLIEPHLSRALWEARHHHGRLQQALADFEAAEREAPSLEDVVLGIAGEPGWSIRDMLIGGLLEQVTTRNVRDELRTAPPSRRLQLYQEASASPADFASAIVLSVMESTRIPYPPDMPAGPDEATAAATLGRLMKAGVQPINPSHPGQPRAGTAPRAAYRCG